MFIERQVLMPEGLNDAVRHLSKANLIGILDTPKRMGPYDVYAVEITDFRRELLAKFGLGTQFKKRRHPFLRGWLLPQIQ